MTSVGDDVTIILLDDDATMVEEEIMSTVKSWGLRRDEALLEEGGGVALAIPQSGPLIVYVEHADSLNVYVLENAWLHMTGYEPKWDIRDVSTLKNVTPKAELQ